MDIVVLEGVEYIKASVVAKRFKYTSDYIGQLCRGKKIDARLVGRTWFVNPESVEEHKKSKHGNELTTKEPISSKTYFESESTDIPINIKPHQTSVPAPLKNKTLKVIEDKKAHRDESRLIKISYGNDEESLFPKMHTKTASKSVSSPSKPPKFVRVEPAQSKKLKIGGSKKPVAFSATELPDVALSGKITVSEYKTPDVVRDSQPKPVVATVVPKVAPKPVVPSETSPVKKVSAQTKPTTFAPAVMQGRIKQTPPNRLVLFSPLIATVLATVVAVVVFSASSLVIVNSQETISKTALQIADVLRIFQP